MLLSPAGLQFLCLYIAHAEIRLINIALSVHLFIDVCPLNDCKCLPQLRILLPIQNRRQASCQICFHIHYCICSIQLQGYRPAGIYVVQSLLLCTNRTGQNHCPEIRDCNCQCQHGKYNNQFLFHIDLSSIINLFEFSFSIHTTCNTKSSDHIYDQSLLLPDCIKQSFYSIIS